MANSPPQDSDKYLGGKLSYRALDEALKEAKRGGSASHAHATKWKNRHPICPYGCDEEGQLLESFMTDDGRLIGIYTDSDGCRFQAEMQALPNPNKRKRILTKDGEIKEVQGE